MSLPVVQLVWPEMYVFRRHKKNQDCQESTPVFLWLGGRGGTWGGRAAISKDLLQVSNT